MLYGLDWLRAGKPFPPSSEITRLRTYAQNCLVFRGKADEYDGLYREYRSRISRVIGNFDDVISFPVLMNYQRFMTLKLGDLVCGEAPNISGNGPEGTTMISNLRDDIDFDAKLNATVIDISRYGDAIWRIYKDEHTGKYTFAVWSPMEWFPIVSQDGTLTETHQVLAWVKEVGNPEHPDYELHVQIHEVGQYTYRVFKTSVGGKTIDRELQEPQVIKTGLKINAVQHISNLKTSDSVFGVDDYEIVDSILAEIMVRVAQVSKILDKHADPTICGPVSMLATDPETGERYLKAGKFYATSPGEDNPEYMTWDGQLEASFKQIEVLINHLYILSEMGAALLGANDASAQVVSGSAMRFKMVNPLAKARRISNNLTLPVKRLLSTLLDGKMDTSEISVLWHDGLPDDPREQIELLQLSTGVRQVMPIEVGMQEYLRRSPEEIKVWLELLKKQQEEQMELQMQQNALTDPEPVKDPKDPKDKPIKGVNTKKKGSNTGFNNFKGGSK